MRRAPVILGLAMLALLAFAALNVLAKNLRVAPRAAHGAAGRIHHQLKNVTRIGGGIEDVRRAVHRAVALDEAAPAPAPGDGGWQARLRAAVRATSDDPGHVVALASEGDDALAWALPGAYWAAYAGVPVVLVGRESAGAEALDEVRRHALPVFVLAPESHVRDAVLAELAGVAERVERVAGATPSEHAVRLAEHRDADARFGWGRTHARLDNVFHYVVSAPSDAEMALEGLPLAPAVAAAFLFAEDTGAVAAATDRYVWSQRADWFTTPSETSFRHVWVIGDRVSYAAQARLDLAPEKAPYVSKGPVALGPMEALALVFLAWGAAGAIFVAVHAQRLVPELMPAARVAWTFTALLLPLVGPILYLAAHRRPKLDAEGPVTRWSRPPAVQAAAATAMGFGFGAPLMICVGYLFAVFGFPLFFGEWASDGSRFLLGAGMVLMMAGMYLLAVLVAWPLAQLPMKRMMSQEGGKRVAWRALGVTALSMAAVSLGMMTTSWWMLMNHVPMMPHEDELLWIFSLCLASTIGFLVAWPLNWPMVRTGLKPGST